jgi:HAD superfamily hydrolase (TIGR01549 family)
MNKQLMNWQVLIGGVERIPRIQTEAKDVNELKRDDKSLSVVSLSSFPLAPRCILFDLDGVLIDTRSMIAKALWYVANVLKVEPPSEDLRLAAAALSPRKAVEKLFPEYPVAFTILQAGIKQYTRELVPCPGVKKLLEYCTGEQIAVVTSRNQVDTDLFLSCSGLRHFFQFVITWGQTSRHKPYPDPLIAAARRLGQMNGIYIGDTPDDMIAAKAGGFYPIGALWASQWNSIKLIESGAAFIADQPGAIIDHLFQKEA